MLGVVHSLRPSELRDGQCRSLTLVARMPSRNTFEGRSFFGKAAT